jgi:hypothetical protein
VGGEVFVDSEMFLVTDFVNLKIKSAQSFKIAHRDRMCVCVFIGGECLYIYEYLYLYCVFKKQYYYYVFAGLVSPSQTVRLSRLKTRCVNCLELFQWASCARARPIGFVLVQVLVLRAVMSVTCILVSPTMSVSHGSSAGETMHNAIYLF